MPTGLLPATIPFQRYQPSRRTTTFGSLRDPIGPPNGRLCPEYALISDPGGGSHAEGFARLKDPHTATIENGQSARSARQTDSLAQNSFSWRDDPFQDLEIKKFPRRKRAL